ncbi:MAG: transposase [Deltaproteobacteria bacterium]|nr:transposase [Nannocystaceae bacterium]
MAMGKSTDEQEDLFVTHNSLRSEGHPFYEALNKVLRKQGFDAYVEDLVEKFYAKDGRPSIAPGVYFRCLLIGYFEAIDSERGIPWRVSDSMSLRHFLRLPLTKPRCARSAPRSRRAQLRGPCRGPSSGSEHREQWRAGPGDRCAAMRCPGSRS